MLPGAGTGKHSDFNATAVKTVLVLTLNAAVGTAVWVP